MPDPESNNANRGQLQIARWVGYRVSDALLVVPPPGDNHRVAAPRARLARHARSRDRRLLGGQGVAAALSAQQTDRARLLFELAGEPSHCTACPRPPSPRHTTRPRTGSFTTAPATTSK
eukprot:scaffold123573_cov63-Phaeocystis_antarctica.AAC.1